MQTNGRVGVISTSTLILFLLVLPNCKNRNLPPGNQMGKDELETFCDMRARVFPDEFDDYTSCLLSMEHLPPRGNLHPVVQQMIDCAVEAALAGDEEAFYVCYNNGHPRESCSERDTTWCEGDELLTCDENGELWYWDCGAVGDQCLYDAEWEESNCAKPCPDGRTSGESWCDGQWQKECQGNLLHSIDCRNLGEVCSNEPTGSTCVPSTTPCDPETFAPHCNGDVFVQCDWSGYVLEDDCRSNIFLTHCGTWRDSVTGCIAEPSSCTESHCDGDVASICLNGELFVYDCSALGLTCVPDDLVVTCGDVVGL